MNTLEMEPGQELDLYYERDRLAAVFKLYYPAVEEHPDWHHNFGHPLEVSRDAINDIELCESHGTVFTANEKLILLDESFIHDVGTLWPLHLSQYPSVEDRSRHIGPWILVHHGVDRANVAEPAGEVTMATKLGEKCQVEDARMTLLRKIARRCDMGNVGKDYDFFRQKALLNWAEYRHFHPDNSDISFKDFWFKKARPVVVGFIFQEDLAYDDWDYEQNGVCGFQNRCIDNIIQLDVELHTI